jgi:ParB-like chromosome segregation protein Spo0J
MQVYNASELATLPAGIREQPINQVVWIHRDDIDANDYNPNHVAPPEMRLLRRSIVKSGWLFPVLVCPPAPTDTTDKPYIIVDGYHRWKVSGDKPIPPAPTDTTDKPYIIVDGYHRWKVSGDKPILALTGGYVPCIVLPISLDRSLRIAMTVRMNRARGTHHVKGMASIVEELAARLGVEPQEVIADLGMDQDEFVRLLDKGKMTKRHGDVEFNRGWSPG